GRPVVTTQIPGVDELITPGRTGWLVRAGDPAALANALREVLEDSVKAGVVGHEGARMVREQFTVNHMVSRITALYEETLSQHGVV
ncbi:MAG: glycosyltransferase, partial [Nitrospirales bacterium]